MKAYTERVFGNVEGKDVLAYRFETDGGYQLEVMTYGATILRYVTPDKAGNFANVILGFDDFDSYVGNSPKHGASVGPVAGRIAGATFELNGKTYDLEVNNASNCNHSGSTGWDSSLFELVEVSDHGLTLYTERTDGTGGFPGNLKIWISYHLEETGAYEISYKVTTDQDTLVNSTNHSYFNLSGDFTQTIDRHVFQLNTEGIYPIAPDGVNAGFLYDQNSGRFLLFKTEAPCFVVYTANFVDESVIIEGQPMLQHNGIALEAQALPDAIHSDLRDQVILKAGQTFTSKTRYELVVK